jgi:hypothetical protein
MPFVIFVFPGHLFNSCISFSLALESAILMSRGVDGTLGVFEEKKCGLWPSAQRRITDARD